MKKNILFLFENKCLSEDIRLALRFSRHWNAIISQIEFIKHNDLTNYMTDNSISLAVCEQSLLDKFDSCPENSNSCVFSVGGGIEINACEYSGIELLTEGCTLDCFSDDRGDLIFYRAVHMADGKLCTIDNPKLEVFAKNILFDLKLRGPWYVSCSKERINLSFAVTVQRGFSQNLNFHLECGFNLVDAYLHQLLGRKVQFLSNELGAVKFDITKRELECVGSIKAIYVDLDDTIIIDNSVVNCELVELLRCSKEMASVKLITRHSKQLKETLDTYCLSGLFDEIFHILDCSPKSQYISIENAIFIDDSFNERLEVSQNSRIPCFGPESVGFLRAFIFGVN